MVLAGDNTSHLVTHLGPNKSDIRQMTLAIKDPIVCPRIDVP